MLKIGSVNLVNRLVMAPMAGITDLPFRLLVKRRGAGLVTTEMISAMGLLQGSTRTMDYLKTDDREKPLAVQIFGSQPDVMAKAVPIVTEAGADIVDINMGCPVKKVAKTGAGAALLRDERGAEALLRAVRRVCHVPLTVKMRSGWTATDMVAYDMARIAEDCGVDAITVHPRSAVQGFSGRADWGVISRIKGMVSIPVIGNGDVLTPLDALEMRKITGCDGVMIGRGAIGNPWIFDQILAFEKGLTPSFPDLRTRRSFILEHFRLLCLHLGERRAAGKIRGLLMWYTKSLPYSSRFRGAINRIKDHDTLVAELDNYFRIIGGNNIEGKIGKDGRVLHGSSAGDGARPH